MKNRGRFKAADMNAAPEQSAGVASMFEPDKRVAGRIRRCVRNLDDVKFTLDDFAIEWHSLTGGTSLDYCDRALHWLVAQGEVEKVGMMYYRATKEVEHV